MAKSCIRYYLKKADLFKVSPGFTLSSNYSSKDRANSKEYMYGSWPGFFLTVIMIALISFISVF